MGRSWPPLGPISSSSTPLRSKASTAGSAKVILKLNAREVLAVAGDPAPQDESDAARATPFAAVLRAAASLADRLKADAVLWTDGPYDAGGYIDGKGIRFVKGFSQLPGPLASPIGAGDAVAGVTFAGIVAGHELVDAFAFGLSCGAASCLEPDNAAFDLGVAKRLPYHPDRVLAAPTVFDEAAASPESRKENLKFAAFR